MSVKFINPKTGKTIRSPKQIAASRRLGKLKKKL
ncbi:MAG: hypothetical protein [Microvirus sp.]|nr:MAG: hypothetical protein [Microvirus sp.]